MYQPWKVTPIFEKTATARTRYILNEGGTRSSKTISNLQSAYKLLENNPDQGLLLSVVSESMPHLKKGAMRDFFEFMLKQHGLYDRRKHNKTDNSYEISGNMIEFFGVEDAGKVHGPSRDFLYCNEIQNMRLSTFRQLCIRTKYAIYADWNPVGDFWIYEDYVDNPAIQDDITFIRSTFKDNPYLAEAQIKEILSIAERDENFRLVYVEGKRGRLEGLVFPNSQMALDKNNRPFWPTDLEKRGFAIDPGFSNDPTAIVECGLYQGEIYARCHSYEVGQETSKVWATLIKKGIVSNIVIDPGGGGDRMGADLRQKGIKIEIAQKKELTESIDLLRQYKINLYCETKDDPLWKERNNYIFKYDKKMAKFTNTPIDAYNHNFDAIRYWAHKHLKRRIISNPWEAESW